MNITQACVSTVGARSIEQGLDPFDYVGLYINNQWYCFWLSEQRIQTDKNNRNWKDPNWNGIKIMEIDIVLALENIKKYFGEFPELP